jgi:hypothetical protein
MARERKLHFGNEVWTYRVGRGNVVIRDPQRKSRIVPFHLIEHVSGFPFDPDERYAHVSPGMVKQFIQKFVGGGVVLREHGTPEDFQASALEFFLGPPNSLPRSRHGKVHQSPAQKLPAPTAQIPRRRMR